MCKVLSSAVAHKQPPILSDIVALSATTLIICLRIAAFQAEKMERVCICTRCVDLQTLTENPLARTCTRFAIFLRFGAVEFGRVSHNLQSRFMIRKAASRLSLV